MSHMHGGMDMGDAAEAYVMKMYEPCSSSLINDTV